MNKHRRLPECDRCDFNASSPYLVCSIHPAGVLGTSCPDFHKDESSANQHEEFINLDWVAEQWEPEGASYYGGELIVTSVQRLTSAQRQERLNYHPLFTGRCPNCEMPMEETEPPLIHWHCSECG